MRIAVTGSTGFVGGAVVRRFAAQGHTMDAYGRRAGEPFAHLPGVTYRIWDIAAGPYPDAPAVDAVIHCAAAVAAWGPYAGFYRANVAGMRHALATFPHAARFVFVSSASVYDPFQNQEGVTEDAPDPPRYVSAYGMTKRLAERTLVASGRPAVILRPRAVYGAGDTTLLPRLLALYRFGRLVVPGDGANRLSLTALDNLLHAIANALEYRGPTLPFNIADDTTPTLNELLVALLHTLGRGPRLLHIPRPLAWRAASLLEAAHALLHLDDVGLPDKARDPALTRYAIAEITRTCTLDCTRAKSLLGYRPTVDYCDVLPSVAQEFFAKGRS